MLFRRLSLAILLILLTGCMTSLLDLPPRDEIIKLKTENGYIHAGSEKYDYYFHPEENYYRHYEQFINQYQRYVEAIALVFDIKEGTVQIEVTAYYNLILNTAMMNNQQLEDLKAHYRVIRLKDGKNRELTAVQFENKGTMGALYGASSRAYNKNMELDDSYRLPKPIPVLINDNTKTLSDAAFIPLIPFVPLYMMYGCATSRCV